MTKLKFRFGNPRTELNLDEDIDSDETELWRSVIHLALADAISVDPKRALHQNNARIWIESPSEDFCLVCDLAGYSPQNVREKYKHLVRKRKENIYGKRNTKTSK